MGSVAAGQVWVVARDSADRTTCTINGAFATKARAIAACRVPEDAVVRFEVDRDMTDIDTAEGWDFHYPLKTVD